MSTTPVPNPLEPTQDEKTMAIFAHVFQIFGSWIAPLIIFLVKRQSRFVSFHALQALLLQIIHVIAIFIFIAIWFTVIFGTVFSSVAHQSAGARPEPPFAFMCMFPILWLFIMGYAVTIWVVAIVYGIKASRGEWAEYPVLGRWARKLLKIGPGGTAFIESN